MFSLFLKVFCVATIVGVAGIVLWPRSSNVLLVCAEPDAMPYSNRAAEGFENKLAEMLAEDRGARVEYRWLMDRQGTFDEMLSRGECDVVMGVPSGVPFAEVSRPYYRSSYMLVYRADGPAYESLDDPRLRSARIGVQVIGDDFGNTPAAFALSRRNLLDNMAPYLMYSSSSGPKPQSELIAAVANRDLDLAIEWGPYAGFFASQQSEELRLVAVPPDEGLIFSYEIGIGMSRHSAPLLNAAIADFLNRRRQDIERLLTDYAIPHAQL